MRKNIRVAEVLRPFRKENYSSPLFMSTSASHGAACFHK